MSDETSIMPEPIPRTPTFIERRARRLLNGLVEGASLSITSDGVPVDIAELTDIEDGEQILFAVTAEGRAAGIVEHYVCAGGRKKEGQGESAALLREATQLIKELRGERRATVQDMGDVIRVLSDAATKFGGVVKDMGKMSKRAVKEQKKRVKAETSNARGVDAVVRELTGALGPERTERLLGKAIGAAPGMMARVMGKAGKEDDSNSNSGTAGEPTRPTEERGCAPSDSR